MGHVEVSYISRDFREAHKIDAYKIYNACYFVNDKM